MFVRQRSIEMPSDGSEPPERKPETPLWGPSSAIIVAIGLRIRALRQKLELTVPELAEQANISNGLLSKIENGKTEASLATIQALTEALNVSIAALLANYDEKRDCLFVPSGGGELISRRGIRIGHQYRLLGHINSGEILVEPYLITLSAEAQPYTRFPHAGVEFIHILDGQLAYRIGDKTYPVNPGDSLLFDAGDFHGPEELINWPISFLSIIIYYRS